MQSYKISSAIPYGESGPVKTFEAKSARDAAIKYAAMYFPEHKRPLACEEQKAEWVNDTMLRVWRMEFYGESSSIVVWIRET